MMNGHLNFKLHQTKGNFMSYESVNLEVIKFISLKVMVDSVTVTFNFFWL